MTQPASSTLYDAIVVGLGAAGAGALYAFAKQGARVVGVDRYAPPHDQGSSHGETRMLRCAYGEGAGYTPLALKSVDLWRALEAKTGTRLFDQIGLTYAGPQSSAFLATTRASAAKHGVPLRDLVGAERASAGYVVPDDWQCFLEPGAGFLYAERAIETLHAAAKARGADIVTGSPVRTIESDGDEVRVVTGSATIRARRAVVCAGGWTAELLPQLASVLSVERRDLHWFSDPKGRYAVSAGFRPFYIEDTDGLAVYGLPDWGGTGVKMGEHIEGAVSQHPDAVDRAARPDDVARTRRLAERFFPDLGEVKRSAVCLYPMSRDEDFILDAAPGLPGVTVLAGLSGHGFKFIPVLGEAAARMALGGEAGPEFAMFRLNRFEETTS
ncbi:MAG TPA: N-methyl-L-tryptophan oxidase [Caulobacteraceae bacterium]|jgi:monomeric sarcosine oxidase|nr:N-methyl-L-tryptophan oxidase [Caulobacteraceae bacterium]